MIDPTRRRLLAALAGGSLLGLAGCDALAGDDETPTETLTPAPVRTPSPTPTPTQSPTPEPVPGLPTPPAEAAGFVTVGMDGRLRFEPETLFVEPDTRVAFVWASDNHNIVVDDQPEAGDWQGTRGSAQQTYHDGHVHQHTFRAPGTYEYHCEPHEAAGMSGAVVVEGPA